MHEFFLHEAQAQLQLALFGMDETFMEETNKQIRDGTKIFFFFFLDAFLPFPSRLFSLTFFFGFVILKFLLVFIKIQKVHLVPQWY